MTPTTKGFEWHWPAWPIGDRDAFPKIDDYAMIGDCRTAALVAASGAIEWLCLPDFSSPSIFAAMLDRARGGTFALRPMAPCTSRRRYWPGTAILETEFTTATGRVRVLDFFSIGTGEHRWNAQILPQRELIRLVEGLEGTVEMVAAIDPRPDYGQHTACFQARPGFGWVVAGHGSLLTVATDMEATSDQDGARLLVRGMVSAGERRGVSMTFAEREIAIKPALGSLAWSRLGASDRWWRDWSMRCVYRGPLREQILRSAITLKMMTYALSGAVVAAPTTSLPEAIGAGRNWDYRFCWLRDASITIRAFVGLGLKEEANAFLGWLLHATRLTRPELRILYDLHGRNSAREDELTHLGGYRDSAPVRVGNAAASQLQLDTYGSVILAAYEYIQAEGNLSGGEMRLLRDFGDVICRRWSEPDQGLWEVRGEPRHFTATKPMCWTGLDRLIRLAEQDRIRLPIEHFRANRAALATAIEDEGFDPRIGAYAGELRAATPVPDAAVLLMGFVDYRAPQERLGTTLDWIEREIGRDGLLLRYPTGFDGFASHEGTFGICLSWAIMTMAQLGRHDRAARSLERLATTANDLGLFAEEYDPRTGESLGNFPQAFSHAGYIAAALAVTREKQAAGEPTS